MKSTHKVANMNLRQAMLALFLLAGMGVGLSACDTSEGPMEETGEEIGNAAEEAGENMDEAAEEAKDEMDDATSN